MAETARPALPPRGGRRYRPEQCQRLSRRRRRYLRGGHVLLQGARPRRLRQDHRPPRLMPPVEHRHGNYLISDDPARLDAEAIHAYLSHSYWAEGIPLETVERSLRNSLCLGVYDAAGAQIGLAR